MPEREHHNEELVTAFPPAWCSRVCKNSLSDLCLEHCAVQRDGSWFDPRPGVTLIDLPRFPLQEFNTTMSQAERIRVIGWYTSLLVDQAQGREAPYVRRRQALYTRLSRAPAEIHDPSHLDQNSGPDPALAAPQLQEPSPGEPRRAE